MSYCYCLQRTILLIGVAVAMCSTSAHAELYINEIFLDPGGAGDDNRDEYIELRGTPGMSLDNHYLILVENEDNLSHTGGAGIVENIFTLGRGVDVNGNPAYDDPYLVGSNGYLLLRQKDSLYTHIAPGTTDILNIGTGNGYGSDLGSSIRHSGEARKVKTENSGFTAMLIRNDGDPFLNQPFLGLDLDVGNDGLDSVETAQFGWRSAWTIIDSIGLFCEAGEAGLGRTYASLNFGPELPGQPLSPSEGGVDDGNGNFVYQPRIEPGATYVGLNYEIEYLARWGDSTGSDPLDWHASNLTDNPLSGSTGIPSSVDGNVDYRQSGGFHDTEFADPPGPNARVETNQGIPYGTPVLTSLGSSNMFFEDGDFDFDGDVDGRDFLTWQRNFGYGDGITLGALTTATRAHGDTNGDWKVDGLDLANWQANYGIASPLAAGTVAVPEPTSFAVLILAALPLAAFLRQM